MLHVDRHMLSILQIERRLGVGTVFSPLSTCQIFVSLRQHLCVCRVWFLRQLYGMLDLESGMICVVPSARFETEYGVRSTLSSYDVSARHLYLSSTILELLLQVPVSTLLCIPPVLWYVSLVLQRLQRRPPSNKMRNQLERALAWTFSIEDFT